MEEEDGSSKDLRGVYVLVIHFPKDVRVRVGCLGEIPFHFGYYGYVGSGLGKGANSIPGRIRRHLSRNKLVFWHIDYVTSLSEVNIVAAFFAESNRRLEHEVSKALKAVNAIGVKGFGSSDCDEGCGSHMFFIGNNLEEAFSTLFKAFRRLGVEPKIMSFSGRKT